MTFNPTDLKWQLTADFKPDKASLWKHPAEKDGWVLAHNMIRQEVNDLIAGLHSIAEKYPNSTPQWAVNSIKDIWSHHYDVIMDHHRNEEEIINPYIKTRVNFPDKLEADHEALCIKMKDVQECIDKLQAKNSLDDLINSMNIYKTTMFPHMEQEEKVGLPLLRAYFTPRQVKAKQIKIALTTGSNVFGSMIDTMGDDYFRKVFMPQEGIPFFAWHIKFRNDHMWFLQNVKCQLNGLIEGNPVNKVKKNSFLCCRG